MNFWESDPLAGDSNTAVASPPGGNFWDADPLADASPAAFGGGQSGGGGTVGVWGDATGAMGDYSRSEQIQNEMLVPGADQAALDAELSALLRAEDARRIESQVSGQAKIDAITKRLDAYRELEKTDPAAYHATGRMRLRLNEELLDAKAEIADTGRLTAYEQSVEDAASQMGMIGGSLPVRAAVGAYKGTVMGVAQTLATAEAEALTLAGTAPEAARAATRRRDDLRASIQRMADEQAAADAQGIIPAEAAAAVRGGTTALAEAAGAASTGGLPALVGYYASKTLADELADADAEGRTGYQKYNVAAAKSLIEGAATFYGGRVLGAGTGELADAGRRGAGEAVKKTLAERAVHHVSAVMAKRYGKSPITTSLMRSLAAAGGEVMEEVATEFADYMVDVSAGGLPFSYGDLLARLRAAAGPAIVAGGMPKAIEGIAKWARERQRVIDEAPAVVEEVEKFMAEAPPEQQKAAATATNRADFVKATGQQKTTQAYRQSFTVEVDRRLQEANEQLVQEAAADREAGAEPQIRQWLPDDQARLDQDLERIRGERSDASLDDLDWLSGSRPELARAAIDQAEQMRKVENERRSSLQLQWDTAIGKNNAGGARFRAARGQDETSSVLSDELIGRLEEDFPELAAEMSRYGYGDTASGYNEFLSRGRSQFDPVGEFEFLPDAVEQVMQPFRAQQESEVTDAGIESEVTGRVDAGGGGEATASAVSGSDTATQPVGGAAGADTLSPNSRRSVIRNLQASFMDETIRQVAPANQAELDAAEFLAARGKNAIFLTTDQPTTNFAGASDQANISDVVLRSGMAENALWATVGHELAHATGFDSLFASKADQDLLQEYIDKRINKIGRETKYTKRLKKDKDLARREGVAELVGDFMRDPAFREQLQRSNPSLFERLRDAILKLVGRWTPRNAAAAEALAMLRQTADVAAEEDFEPALLFSEELMPDDPTGTKHAITDMERERLGLPEADPADVRSRERVFAEAEAIMQRDPQAAEKLIDDLLTNPRPIQDVENAILLRHNAQLRNEFNAADAAGDKKAREDVQLRMWLALDAERIGGTATGQALAARRQNLNLDFTFPAMMARESKARGRMLTPEEETTIRKQAERIAELEAQVKANEQKAADAQFDKEIARLIKIVGSREKLDVAIKKRNEAGAKLFEKLKNPNLFTSGGLDPEILSMAVEFVRASFEVGIRRFDLFIQDAIEQYGQPAVDQLRPALETAWEQVRVEVGDAEATVAKDPKAPKAKVPDGPDQIMAKVPATRLEADVSNIARKLAKAYIRQGVTGRDQIIDAVHARLQEWIPGMTRRQAMDAISLYGQSTLLNPEVVATRLREYAGEMQQVAKLLDMQEGRAPKKTGMERRTPTDEERRLIKLVNEAKKKYNIQPTDKATQLKSALEAIKTRLRNQITDYQKAIDDRERLITKRSAVQYDAEANKLKAARDAVKEQYDAMFAKPGLTDAQRAEIATRAVERSIKDWETRINRGDFEPRGPKSSAWTPELSIAKARLEAQRARYKELKALDPASQVDANRRANYQLQRQIAEARAKLEAKISAGNYTRDPAKPSKVELTPAVQKAREELDTLRAEFNKKVHEIELREAWTKEKASLDQQLQTGKYDQKPEPPPKQELPPDLATLQKQVEDRRRMVARLTEEAERRKDPWYWPKQILSLAQNIQLGLDFGQLGRQGKLALGHPVMLAKQIRPMLGFMADKKNYDANREKIEKHPLWLAARNAKLEITTIEGAPSKAEEGFRGDLAHKLAIIKNFDRGYTGFLNNLRFEWFVLLHEKFEQSRGRAPTKEEAHVLANMINVFTGRGAIPDQLAGAAEAAGYVLLAPKFQLSRAQTLMLQPLWGAGPKLSTIEARKMVAVEYAKAAAGVAAWSALVVGGAAMFFNGDDDDRPLVGMDPAHWTFGKWRVGNTWVDPYGGLQPWAVLASKFWTGRWTRNGQEDITRFTRARFNPLISQLWTHLVAGKTWDGKDPTLLNSAREMLSPLGVSQIVDLSSEEGIGRKLTLGMLGFVGEGLMTLDLKGGLHQEYQRLSGQETRTKAEDDRLGTLTGWERVKRRLSQKSAELRRNGNEQAAMELDHALDVHTVEVAKELKADR